MLGVVFIFAFLVHSFVGPSQVPEKIIKSVLDDACSSGCTEAQISSYKNHIKSERHDLNGDGVSEFFVYIDHSDLCGAGFNCSFWIYQRQRSGYRLLLKDYPVVRVGNQITNGYKDLESQGRMGACLQRDGKVGREIYLTVFKWNANEYKSQVIGERCLPRTKEQDP